MSYFDSLNEKEKLMARIDYSRKGLSEALANGFFNSAAIHIQRIEDFKQEMRKIN